MIDLGKLTRRAFALDSAFRPLVDDLLRLLSDALQAHQEAGDLEVMAALDEHRRRLLEGLADEDLDAFAESCAATARAAVTRARERQIEQHAELARCVTQIRDTLRLLAGDGEKPASEIDGAADRFAELLAMEDFGQLKAKLAQEVVQLRQVAEERRQQWHDATEMFASRVAVLETQLAGVREEASLDPLTRVGSRRFFEATLAERIQVSMRHFAVAILDLDDFKSINDTHGHQAGDRVLQEVGGALKAAMRPGDVVARLGGDEFVAIMVGVSLRQAEMRLQDVLTAIAEHCAAVDGLPRTSVSCGVAECSAGDTADSVVARADRALYDAKKKGKNRVAGRAMPFIRDLLKV